MVKIISKRSQPIDLKTKKPSEHSQGRCSTPFLSLHFVILITSTHLRLVIMKGWAALCLLCRRRRTKNVGHMVI